MPFNDWTMELWHLVADRFCERWSEHPRDDVASAAQLYEDCEQAKRDFARLAQVTVACRYRDRVDEVTITRREFEERTEWKMAEVVMWCERALAKVQRPVTWADVDRILLVGGSSRLRRMSLALQEASGKTPVQTSEPELTLMRHSSREI